MNGIVFDGHWRFDRSGIDGWWLDDKFSTPHTDDVAVDLDDVLEMAEEIVRLRAENEKLRLGLAPYARPEYWDPKRNMGMGNIGRAVDTFEWRMAADALGVPVMRYRAIHTFNNPKIEDAHKDFATAQEAEAWLSAAPYEPGTIQVMVLDGEQP